MGNNVIPHIGGALQAAEFTPEQVELIKATVAKGATDNELKLFLYRCQNMGLDPLKPGQVHFIKYGSNPGSIVVGIDGFRVKAARTGKLVGIKRGAIRDEAGKLIGAWCEVYRKDWTHPAREEVSLAEYNTGKAMWAKMPETMIKKVAEAAALRMAFPDDLGGMYAEEEMQQAEPVRDVRTQEIQAKLDASDTAPEFEDAEYFDPIEEAAHYPGSYIVLAGTNKGKRIQDIAPATLKNFITWYDTQVADKKKFPVEVSDYYEAAHAYLTAKEQA